MSSPDDKPDTHPLGTALAEFFKEQRERDRQTHGQLVQMLEQMGMIKPGEAPDFDDPILIEVINEP